MEAMDKKSVKSARSPQESFKEILDSGCYILGAILGHILDTKSGPGETKLAPRGLRGGTKKHQSDERGDTQTQTIKHNVFEHF